MTTQILNTHTHSVIKTTITAARHYTFRSPQISFLEKSIGKFVPFEVFTAVVMKSIVFWNMTPCSPLSVNRRFGGTYRLHLQGRRNKFSNKPPSEQVAAP
jgi:hypothetical protein